MTIDWQHFTPWTGLAGGMLIGAGAALLVLCNGRVAGVSGVLGALLRSEPGERGWRFAFLAGLLLAAPLWRLFAAPPAAQPVAQGLLLAVAGLLVGVGTRYGGGCTSGHGVCGIARASPRSAVATAVFVLAGGIAVYLLRHGADMTLAVALLAGLLFGVGLLLSGMTDPVKVSAFLDVAGAWDPSLLCVMIGAIGVATPAFRLAARRKRALTGAAMQLPAARTIDRRLVLGSAAFGIGWGISGYCPGSVLASLTLGVVEPWIFVLAMVAGMGLFELAEWRRRAFVSPETPG